MKLTHEGVRVTAFGVRCAEPLVSAFTVLVLGILMSTSLKYGTHPF